MVSKMIQKKNPTNLICMQISFNEMMKIIHFFATFYYIEEKTKQI